MAIGHPCDGLIPCKRPNAIMPVSIAVDDNCQYLTQEQYVIFYITDSSSLRNLYHLSLVLVQLRLF
jgi:hypothetical protein